MVPAALADRGLARVAEDGLQAEHLRHRTGEHIERAVTISAVIAWRLVLMTLLGRPTQQLPAPTTLGGAVRAMSRMAVQMNRKGDALPRHQKKCEDHADLSGAARA